MHVKNYEILATKENAEKYMPILDLDRVTRALYSVTQDLDTACGGAMFFYRKNTNEYIARKFSYYLTKKYLEDYAPKYKFKMESFEAGEFEFQQSLYYAKRVVSQ